jgi:hypothetical protein
VCAAERLLHPARLQSEATGNKQQDLIGKEVVAFMASNGSMKVRIIVSTRRD